PVLVGARVSGPAVGRPLPRADPSRGAAPGRPGDRGLPVHDRPGARRHDRSVSRARAARRGIRGAGQARFHHRSHGADVELPPQGPPPHRAMKPLRVLALMHEDLVPPDDPGSADLLAVPWKTEYDVVSTLRELGHEVRALGVRSDLRLVREAIEEWQPHIAFNLLEEF